MSDVLASTIVALTLQVKALVEEMRALREELERENGEPGEPQGT